jgi:hypothetical protein
MEKREERVITVWVTKYALSIGVFITKARVCTNGNGSMVEDIERRNGAYYHGKDWQESEALALANVRARVAARLRSINKTKLKVMALSDDLDHGRLPMAKERA